MYRNKIYFWGACWLLLATFCVPAYGQRNLTNWISSPNSAQKFPQGGPFGVDINLNVYKPATISIELYKGTSRVFGPAAATYTASDSYSYYRLNASDFPVGDDYRFHIFNSNDPSEEDWSNAYFSIVPVPADLSHWITSPNGGEVFALGANVPVGIDGNVYNPGPVNVDLYKGSRLMTKSNTSGIINRYVVTTGMPPGDDYKVRIFYTNNSEQGDWSDGFFSIGVNPGLSNWIVSPNGGEVYDLGPSMTVTLASGMVSTSLIGYELYKGEEKIYNNAVPAGSPITIPTSSLAVGSDYRVRVYDAANQATRADMSGYFSVGINPALTNWLLEPQARNFIEAGTSVAVTVNKQVFAPASMSIELYRGTQRVYGPVTGGLDDRTIPTGGLSLAYDYRVKVYETGKPVNYAWSQNLTIGPVPNLSAWVTSPSGGEVFGVETKTIRVGVNTAIYRPSVVVAVLYKGDVMISSTTDPIEREQTLSLAGLPDGSDYRVKVMDALNYNLFDWSNYFTKRTNQNYVKGKTVLVPGVKDKSAVQSLSVENVLQTNQYFDGLGRSNQTVIVQGSPAGYDVVSPVFYDEFGREVKKFEPYVAKEKTGAFKDLFLTGNAYRSSEQAKFYGGSVNTIAKDSKPYGETIVENSTLGRPLLEYGPGEAWSSLKDNKYVRYQYKTNTHDLANNATGERIIAWTVNADGMPVRKSYREQYVEQGGYFSSGRLQLKITEDENGRVVREYADRHGRVILKKVQAEKVPGDLNRVAAWALTYYVYDDFNNLRYVFPPELSRLIHSQADNYAVTAVDLSNWAFQYTYDAQKHVIQKQAPGVDPVYVVYDGRDRVVLTQDGKQRIARQWMFTKYDELNRVIATGIKDTTSVLSVAEMQQVVRNHYAKTWARYGERFIGAVAGAVSGYSNRSYPVVTVGATTPLASYHTFTYYDNYDFKACVFGDYDYVNQDLAVTVGGRVYRQPSQPSSVTTGQTTGTRVRVLDNHLAGSVATWLTTVNYYDDRERLSQVVSDNYRGGSDRMTKLYDFSGKALKSQLHHYGLSWKDFVACKRVGNRLVKTQASAGWTAGAASVEVLPANQDGWVEFTTPTTNRAMMIGFSEQNTNADWTGIGVALYLTAQATVEVREQGSTNVLTPVPAYSIGDVFRIERKQNKARFYKNGLLLTERTMTTNAVLIDLSVHGAAAVLNTLRSSFGSYTAAVVTRRHEYDNGGRMTDTWHQIGTSPEIHLVKNIYNELGQLVDKKLHSTLATAADAKQSVDYRYNIRGWLTSINDVNLSNTGTTNDDTGDYFGMNLAYYESLGTGNTTSDVGLSEVLVGSYPLNGNASDAVANGLNGIVHGAQPATDALGNAAGACSFTLNDYIEIPGSQEKHAYIGNTGKFTLAAFLKLDNLEGRNIILANTATSALKGFTFMYETYGGGFGDHQLRLIVTNGQAGTSFSALGGVRTIQDTQWHHVAVVGDGQEVRFYVDGVLDGMPSPITLFSTGSSSGTTLLGKSRSSNGLFLGLEGALDDVMLLDRPATPAEIQALSRRENLNTPVDVRQYNGNLSGMKWSVNQGLNDTKAMGYNFVYDPLSRLQSATNVKATTAGSWSDGGYHEANMTYDLQGNIRTLKRYNDTGTPLDNLVYTYTAGAVQGNKLLKVSDTGNKYGGFVDGTNTDNDFTYDVNGNMLTDKNKGLTTPIAYNELNLPATVTLGAATAQYVYDATGRKLARVTTFVYTGKQTDYAGDFVYVDDVLEAVQHEEGRVLFAQEKLVYASDGDSPVGMIPTDGTTLTPVVQPNGQSYMKVASNATQGNGIMMGGPLAANAGDRFRIRVKGYRAGNNNVCLYARTNLGDIQWTGAWYGAAMPSAATTETWIQEVVTIPPGATQLEVGLRWNNTVANEYFMLNEVEVVRLDAVPTPEYQYDIKDHLGNIRVTFTTRDDSEYAVATMETSHAAQEYGEFLYYDEAIVVNQELFDYTHREPGNQGQTTYYSTRLTGGDTEAIFGLAKSISVMPGDVIHASVRAKYVDPTATLEPDLKAFLLSIAAGGNPAPGTIVDGGASGSIGQSLLGITPIDHAAETGVPPKAYLNYIVYNKDMSRVIDQGYKRITTRGRETGTNTDHDELILDPITVRESGYVYLYLSNENPTPVEVYFDDFTVDHTKSPVIQSQDYYPFGLAFNTQRRENTVQQLHKYNGKEEQQDLNLGWLDYGMRMYQPEIGRFFTPDRFAGKYQDQSPYGYSLNNPALYVDINGDSVWVTATIRQDAKGNTIVTQTVHIEGKVLKAYSGSVSASSVATGLNARLNAQTSSKTTLNDDKKTTTTTIIKISANYTAASSMADVKTKDHLVVIVDNVTGKGDSDLGGGEANGRGERPGKLAYIEAGDAIETAFHEVGHNLGLPHPKVNDTKDPMSYTGRNANFNEAQMVSIVDQASSKYANSSRNYGVMEVHFPDVKYGTFYNTSTSERPFTNAPGPKTRIPAPMAPK